MNIKKHFTIALFYSVLTLGMFFGLQYIFAWTNPTLSPPSGNISPPINEGTTAQVKDGSFGVSGNFIAGGLSSFSQIEFGGEIKDSWPSGDTTPSGAIMAFNLSSCPSGWTEYTPARDRTIIGSGSSYSRGATGGASTHTLTISEMPSHSHSISPPAASWTTGPYNFDWTGGNPKTQVFNTQATGGSQAHNNMQPYIALLYCIKD